MTRAPALLGCFALFVSACATAPAPQADAQNFQRCLQGDAWCDQASLTAQERERIVERSAALHLEHCLAGKRCNDALLSDTERAQVQAAVIELNLQACLAGDSGCRSELLDGAQQARVTAADRARNVERCLDALPGCDLQALRPDEREAARQRYLARNFAACQQGFASNCQPHDLDPEQAALVQERRLQANLFLCTYALVGCVDALLTPQQRQEIAALREAPVEGALR
jgi:hypothetical protein